MIRQANHSDIPYILEMYKLGLEELGETKFSESLMLDKVLSSYNLAPCFLLIKDGNIIGMAGLTIITSTWNGDASLVDYMFYVRPEHRNIKNLSALILKVKAFSDKSKLPLRLEFSTDISAACKERLARMFGFKVASMVGTYGKG